MSLDTLDYGRWLSLLDSTIIAHIAQYALTPGPVKARPRDYALGRRNCQQFLRAQFILPQGNPVIAPGRDPDAKVLAAFGMNPPNATVEPQNQRWIPLIPLCGTATVEGPQPQRASMSDDDLDEVVDLIVKRFKAIVPLLLPKLPSIAVHAVDVFVALNEKGELKTYLRNQLP
jgi:hypothetical protein